MSGGDWGIDWVHRVEVVEEGTEGDGHVGVGQNNSLGYALGIEELWWQ